MKSLNRKKIIALGISLCSGAICCLAIMAVNGENETRYSETNNSATFLNNDNSVPTRATLPENKNAIMIMDEEMSENKKTVMLYMQGFRDGNHENILSCLTEDVHWYMPGFINATGKVAFDKEIENDFFEGKPDIKISRLTEENDVVIAEGSVQAKIKSGGILDAVFCDVFEMKAGKIRQLTTYQMNK